MRRPIAPSNIGPSKRCVGVAGTSVLFIPPWGKEYMGEYKFCLQLIGPGGHRTRLKDKGKSRKASNKSDDYIRLSPGRLSLASQAPTTSSLHPSVNTRHGRQTTSCEQGDRWSAQPPLSPKKIGSLLRPMRARPPDCKNDKTSNIRIDLIDSSPFHLKGSFPGPEDTPYQGGHFEVVRRFAWRLIATPVPVR